MVDRKELAGRWLGRLVDVQGFEGELALNLDKGDGDDVSGQFSVMVGATHSSLEQRGKVQGRFDRGRLELGFELQEPPVGVKLQATAQDLRGGGYGLSGNYEVSARGFSPLQGGAMAAAKDQPSADQVMPREKQG